MAVWSAIPKMWLAWDFDVRGEGGQTLGEVRLSSWRERGAVVAADVEYGVSRESLLGAFVLEKEGVSLARAVKPSALFRSFEIEHEGRSFTLKALSPVRRAMVMSEGDIVVGTIEPEGMLTRRARIKMLDELSPPLILFAVWLTLLMWKRESDAGHPGRAWTPGRPERPGRAWADDNGPRPGGGPAGSARTSPTGIDFSSPSALISLTSRPGNPPPYPAAGKAGISTEPTEAGNSRSGPQDKGVR